MKDSILDMNQTSNFDDLIYKNLVNKQNKLEVVNDEFLTIELIIKKYQKDCKFILNNKLLHYFNGPIKY